MSGIVTLRIGLVAKALSRPTPQNARRGLCPRWSFRCAPVLALLQPSSPRFVVVTLRLFATWGFAATRAKPGPIAWVLGFCPRSAPSALLTTAPRFFEKIKKTGSRQGPGPQKSAAHDTTAPPRVAAGCQEVAEALQLFCGPFCVQKTRPAPGVPRFPVRTNGLIPQTARTEGHCFPAPPLEKVDSEPVFTTLTIPPGRIFFRHTALIFLEIHKVFLRQIALSGEKISRPSGTFGCEYRFSVYHTLRLPSSPSGPAGAKRAKNIFSFVANSGKVWYTDSNNHVMRGFPLRGTDGSGRIEYP